MCQQLSLALFSWCKKFEENQIDQANFDQPHIYLRERNSVQTLRIMIQPQKMGFLHISGYMRIQATCSLIRLI